MKPYGWALIQYDWCPYKRRFGHRCENKEERPCEDTVRGWTSASQGESSPKKPTLLTTWSWTATLQNYEEIKNVSCLSHVVCGTLLGQPSRHSMRLDLCVAGCLAASLAYTLILVAIPQPHSGDRPKVFTHRQMSPREQNLPRLPT